MNAFLFAGLPAAGKTTAATLAADITGSRTIESGNVIRQLAQQNNIDANDSDALGEFASKKREEEGPAFVAERITGEILRGDLFVDDPVIIDGVRHRDEVIEYRRYFDNVTLVWIEASPEVRLNRIQERGRDGEDNFDALDLANRDDRELIELGVSTLLDDTPPNPDVRIENNNGENTLQDDVSALF